MGSRDGSGAVAGLLREALRGRGNRAVVAVTSTSMEPVLRAGDRVTIESIDPSSLRRGDIVVFDSPLAGLVVHRLMWKVPPLGRPRAVFTKGDALEHCDRPTAVTEVLGRVVEVERGRKRTKIGGAAAAMKWFLAAASWGWRRGLGGIGRKALIHRENR